MRVALAIAATASAGLAWLLLRRVPDGTTTTTTGEAEAAQELDTTAPLWSLADVIAEAATPTEPDMADNNTAAFLGMIRQAEGTAGPNGYRTLFGGALFDSYADHPRRAVQFRDKLGRVLWTTAAGAYQAMAVSPIPTGGYTRSDTWDRISAKLGLPDFSPASQDAFAIELIRQAGALGDVRAGRFDQAVAKVRGIWASMPGAGYAQPEKSLEALRLAYLNAGGTLA